MPVTFVYLCDGSTTIITRDREGVLGIYSEGFNGGESQESYGKKFILFELFDKYGIISTLYHQSDGIVLSFYDKITCVSSQLFLDFPC